MMEIQKNNTDYELMVKKIFAFLLYRAENFYSRNVDIIWRTRNYDESFDYIYKVRSLGDPTWSVFGFITIFLGIILMMMFFINGVMPVEIGTVFILVSWIVGFIMAINDFSRRMKISFQYKQMEKYFFIKGKLAHSLGLLKSEIALDLGYSDINPININLIGETIGTIGELVTYIQGPLKDFSELRSNIETNTIELLDGVVIEEKNEVLAYARELDKLLHAWLVNHKLELAQYAKNISQEKNQVISLAVERLNLYIESLGNIEVKN